LSDVALKTICGLGASVPAALSAWLEPEEAVGWGGFAWAKPRMKRPKMREILICTIEMDRMAMTMKRLADFLDLIFSSSEGHVFPHA